MFQKVSQIKTTNSHFKKVFLAGVLSLAYIVGSLFAYTAQVEAAIPKYINFQGKLTAVSGGTNVANGTYAFEFKLYDALTSGSLLWTETFDQPSGSCGKLTVTNGVFNAKLGTCASLSSVDFTGGSVYLSVNFAPTGTSYDGEMSPRKQLVSSAYAFVANGVSGDGAVNTTNSSATALTVAKAGTDYALQVDTSAGSAVTGLKVTSAAAAGGLALTTLSTATDESLTINAKGAGQISLGSTSTGNINIGSSGTGDILLGGGSGSTGCTVTNSTGAFACTAGGSFSTLGLSGAITGATGITSSGTIQFSSLTSNGPLYTSAGNGTLTTTAPTSGVIGYWSRSGTTLSATTANDIVTLNTSNTTGADLGITNSGVYTGTGILNLTANSATTGTLSVITGNGLTTGSLLSLSSNGTGALTGQKGLNISLQGTNGTGSQTTYAAYLSNTHAGSGTNVGLYATASGGTNNYAAIFAGGNVGVNTTSPSQKLEVSQGNIKAVGVQTPAGFSGTATTGGSLATNNYYYAITAVDATGESSPTYTYVNVGGANNAVNLSWTASPLATSYNIYRSTSPGGVYVSYNTASTSFNDTGAAGGSSSPPVANTAYGALQSNMGINVYNSTGLSLINTTGFAGGYAIGPRVNIIGDYFSFGSSGEGGGNGAQLRVYQGLDVAGSDNTYVSAFNFKSYYGDAATFSAQPRSGQLFLTDAGSAYRFYAYPGVADGAAAVGYTLDTSNSLANASAKLLAVRNQGSEKLTVLASGNLGVGDTSPAALLTVGSGDLFQVNSSGAIAAATGVTSSGTITFSGLGGGGTQCLQTSNTGVISGTGSACGAGSVTWNSIANPTGTQSLTFDDGELNSWTVSSDTETFHTITANSLTTGKILSASSSSLSSGTLIDLAVTGTAAASNTQTVLNVATSGANGTSTQTTYGAQFANTHSGTSSTNIAAYFTASGGTDNYAIIVPSTGGNSGFGTTTPTNLSGAGSYFGNNQINPVWVSANDPSKVTALVVQGNLGQAIQFIDQTGTAKADFGYYSSEIYIVNRAGGGTRFYNNSTNVAMFLDSNANLGLGTSTSAPASRLEVKGASGQLSTLIGDAGYGTGYAGISVNGTFASNSYTLLGDASNLMINRPSGGDMYFREGNTTQMILKTSTGNLGIGDTSPAALLTVGSGDLFQVNSSGAIAAATGIVSSGTIQFSSLTSNGPLYTSAGNGTLTTTAPTSGAIGYWTRTGTVLSQTTANDTISIANTTTTGADLSIVNTGIYTGTGVVNIVADSADTGNIVSVSGAGLTSGTALYLTGPSGTNFSGSLLTAEATLTKANSKLLNLVATYEPVLNGDATTGISLHGSASSGSRANISQFYNRLDYTNNTIASLYLNNNYLSTTSTSAQNIYGTFTELHSNGTITTGTANIYGSAIIPDANSLSSGGTVNVYSYYSGSNAAVVDTGGTINSYGLYVANQVMNTTGTSTKYGIYVEDLTADPADNNYAAIFAGGNVGIGTTAPDRPLEVNSATGLGMRLTYNDADGSASNYADLQVSSAGALNVLPSGFITNIGGGTTQTALRFLEPSGTGTDYAAIQSNANVTTSYTWTLPAADASGCIQSNGSGTLSISACGGAASLQTAYDGTNTITTTTARNIAFTLAEVATPTSFTIENQDTAATSAQRIFNSIASGTATNGLLIEQTGAGTMTNAIQIAETSGTITDGILITGTLGNILNSPSLDITGAGAITGATGITSSGTIQFSSLTSNGPLYTSAGNGTLTTTAPTSGAIGYWTRTGTVLSQTTANDTVNITGTTSPQLTLGYDVSNYLTASVGSTGAVTLDSVGSGAQFNFQDNVVGSGSLNADGTTPNSLYSFNVTKSGSFSNGTTGYNAALTKTGGSGATTGFSSLVTYNATGTTSFMGGGSFGVATSTAGAVTPVLTYGTGIQGTINNPSGATITTGVGGYFSTVNSGTGTTHRGIQIEGGQFGGTLGTYNAIDITSYAAGGTLTTLKGINMSGWSSGGTVTTSYGIFMDSSIDIGSTRYALYSTSSSNSYMSGNLGLGDASPAALLTVGNGDLFQVNSSGAIAAATGVTSSGTITFSGLGGGGTQCLQTSNTGVISGTGSACGAGSVTWNSIANPTGTQSLTFDDGELNSWTVSSDTETFHTITANSLTTGTLQSYILNGLTTGTGLSLSSSSTAITSASLLQGTFSGAPASSWTGDIAKFEATSADADLAGNILKLGYTGSAAGDGTVLNVTTAQTGSSAYALRVNDDGTYTDSTPFVIDANGQIGAQTTTLSDYLFTLAGTTGNDNSRVISITQANDAAEDSDAIRIANTINAGTVNGTSRSVYNYNSSFTPVATITNTGGGAGTTFNVYSDYNTINLGSITVQDTGTALGENTYLQVNNSNNLISGSITLNKTAGTRTESMNVYGAQYQVQPGLTISALSAGTVSYYTYGGSFSNGSTSPGDANLTSNAYGLLVNNTASLTTTGTTTKYGGYFNSSSGTADTNYGIYATVGGATVNYAAILTGGNVGIGITAPTSLLHVQQSSDSTDTTNPVAFDVNSVGAAGELTASSGVQTFARIAPTVNQSSTAGYTALLINSTQTATGSGAKLLQDWQVGGSSVAKIDSTGALTVTSCTGCGGGGGSLSSLTAATADDTDNDNLNYQIDWDWSTISTQNAFALNATGTGLTSGSIFKATTASTGNISAGAVQFSASGNYSGTGGLLNATATASTAGTLVNFTNNTSSYTGNLLAMSLTGQTSGTGLSITGGGANMTASGELIDLQMGAATVGSGLNITTTGAYTGAGILQVTANSATTGTLASVSSSSLTSGKLLDLQVSGTAAAASQTALNILTTGANGTAGITTYGAQISNTHSGGTSTNVGLYSTATGGTNNYAAIFDQGNVGIGTATPGTKLTVDSNSNTSSVRILGATEASEIADIYVQSGGRIVIDTTVGSSTSGFIDLKGEDNEYGLVLRDSSGVSTGWTNFYMNDTTTDYLNVCLNCTNAGVTGLVVQDGGNVGVGTTGPDRKFDSLDASNPQVRLTTTDGSVYADLQNTATANLVVTGDTLTSSSAKEYGIQISPTVNQTSSASYTGLEVNVTETAATTINGLNRLADFRVGGSSKFAVRNDGSLTLQDASGITTPYGGIGSFQNHLVRSEEFDNASWVKTSVTAPTANTQVAPDGSTSAESLATSGSGGDVCQWSGTAAASDTFTFSVWAKSTSGTQNFDLRIDAGATSCATANNVTGTAVTHTATTSWQRFTVTQTFSSATGNVKARIFPGGTGGTGTIYAWGAQLDLASKASTYVLTTGGALTNANKGQVLESNFATASGFTYGGRHVTTLTGAISASSSTIGQLIRVIDNASGTDDTATVRGLEVQSYSGTNINGINTAVAAFGYTFGVHAATTGQANEAAQPAAVFADLDNGSAPTSGNAIRAYSNDATSADLVSIYQETSAYSGNALEININGTFTGNFTDFQTSGTTKFKVDKDGNAFATLNTGNSERLCWDGAGGTAEEIFDCTGTPGDLAENFGTTDASIEAMDIVVSDGHATDLIKKGEYTTKAYIEKSTKGYQSNIIGVISTNPNEVYANDIFTEAENPRPVALVGRVPVKVTLENGPIVPGDYITSSNIEPGKGMKAIRSGMVVGQALSGYDGTGEAQVIVFVNTGFQSIGNTIVLDAPPVSAVNLQSGEEDLTNNNASTFVIQQQASEEEGSEAVSNILQLQTGDANRFMVSSTGATSILSNLSCDPEALPENSDCPSVLKVTQANTELMNIDARGTLTLAGTIFIKDDSFAGSVVTAEDGLAEITFSYNLGTGKPVVQLTAESQIPVFAQIVEFKQDENGNYTGFVIKTFDLLASPVQAIVHYNVTGKQADYITLGDAVVPDEELEFYSGEGDSGDGVGLVIEGGEVVGNQNGGNDQNDGGSSGDNGQVGGDFTPNNPDDIITTDDGSGSGSVTE